MIAANSKPQSKKLYPVTRESGAWGDTVVQQKFERKSRENFTLNFYSKSFHFLCLVRLV
jgi:hypothetical protein